MYGRLARRTEGVKGAVIAFAHNARGYDGHFVLQDLFDRQLRNPSVIMVGRKILQISVGNVKFIDSRAYFLQPLSALPNAFGLPVGLAKGHFPHFLNKPENYD